MGCDGALGSDEALSSTSASDLELSAGDGISGICQSSTDNAAASSSDNSVPMMRVVIVWMGNVVECRDAGWVEEKMPARSGEWMV